MMHISKKGSSQNFTFIKTYSGLDKLKKSFYLKELILVFKSIFEICLSFIQRKTLNSASKFETSIYFGVHFFLMSANTYI